jgi:hypothetical protein
MNFLKKSKDNKKARQDLAMICHQPSLELSTRGTKTHAPFCLIEKGKKRSNDVDKEFEISRWFCG